jgi:hypothetical protein
MFSSSFFCLLLMIVFFSVQVEDINKVNLIASGGLGSISRSVSSDPVQGNLGVTSNSSSNSFVFGTVSSNFQVFCNFSGQSDPLSVASTVASIVSNLKESGGIDLLLY